MVVVIWQYGAFAPKPASLPEKRIGFVVTTLDNPYFVTMTESAREEAKKCDNVQLSVQAPERAVDTERQLQIVESLIAQRIAVLAVVPADSTQILTAIREANEASIPAIVLDNRANEKLAAQRGITIDAFVGSNNVQGGRIAGQFVAERLGGEGEVAILEGVPGVEAAIDRKAGFVEAVAAYPGIHIVASQSAEWDREKAYNITRGILIANSSLRAIFGANDEMALGALKALRDLGRQASVIVVGYDATPEGITAVESGQLAATVAQQPAEVGRVGVVLACDLIQGKSVPKTTILQVSLVTAR